MRIGIITPTVSGEYTAVEAPKGADVLRVIVVDGALGVEPALPLGTECIHLPRGAYDAGATPRAIGSAYALGQGCDVIAFLDDDNGFEPEHLRNAVHMIAQGAEVVTSLRVMVSPAGEVLGVDTHDSDGINFCDTNCVVLAGKAAKFATTWNWFSEPSGTDRIFWDRLKKSFGSAIVCTGQPTVRYVTRWAAHYQGQLEDGSPAHQPPNPAKFVRVRNGIRISLQSEPVWNGSLWMAKEDGKP